MTLFPTDARLQILSLSPTARDSHRTMVRVGDPDAGTKGKVVATLNTRLINDLGLYKGQPWNDTLAKQVEDAKGFDKAFRAATRRLARRAMSRRMIDDKLRQLDHSAGTRAAVLERLEQLDLIDDEQFGRMLVRAEMSRKPAGPMLLKQKLFAKGISGSLADKLVAEATDDPDEQRDTALAFAEKKIGAMRRLDPDARYRRLYGQLARRGFKSDTIRHVMETLRDELRAGDDDDTGSY
ncbi:regulatory protein RecX [Phycisphaeraceae bacterium D3-23]